MNARNLAGTDSHSLSVFNYLTLALLPFTVLLLVFSAKKYTKFFLFFSNTKAIKKFKRLRKRENDDLEKGNDDDKASKPM
jgi:1,4-dihydroxy-2-naphthoate octaprenyltransferase